MNSDNRKAAPINIRVFCQGFMMLVCFITGTSTYFVIVVCVSRCFQVRYMARESIVVVAVSVSLVIWSCWWMRVFAWRVLSCCR